MKFDLTPLHSTLTPYQLAILTSSKRFTCTIASTKAGKTYSHLVDLLTQFLCYPCEHGNFWWVAPIYSQAEIAFNRMQRELAPFGVFKFNLSKLTISIGSRVMAFKSADNPDGLYGDDVYHVIFDEFTRAKPESMNALRSTLTKTKGKMRLIGNYTGDSNWGVLLKEQMKDNPEWEFFTITAIDAVNAGILDQAEIDQARLDLPADVFEALYMARGGFDAERLVLNPALNDLFTNDFVEHGRKALTADIAMMGSDMFVVMVWSGYRLQKCYSYPKADSKQVREIIADIAHSHSVPYSRICYDADGLGQSLTGYFPDSLPFNGNKRALGNRQIYKNRKAQIHYEGSRRLNESEYYIEPDALTGDEKRKLIQELAAVKRAAKDKDGLLRIQDKEQIKQNIGRSPDYSDAFFLREHIRLISGE